MLKSPNPRLRRLNIVVNSFGSCISNTPEESSSAPEVSFSEIISQPGMFVQKFKSSVALKQLKSFANTNCWRDLHKQVDMINSDVKSINFESVLNSDFTNKPLTINSNSKKFKWVPSILGFPNKVEGILSKLMAKTFQIHFFPPKLTQKEKAHANFDKFISRGSTSEPLSINNLKELNLVEQGNSSPCLKAGVSLPLM